MTKNQEIRQLAVELAEKIFSATENDCDIDQWSEVADMIEEISAGVAPWEDPHDEFSFDDEYAVGVSFETLDDLYDEEWS